VTNRPATPSALNSSLKFLRLTKYDARLPGISSHHSWPEAPVQPQGCDLFEVVRRSRS
jgi:hypothetical protein